MISIDMKASSIFTARCTEGELTLVGPYRVI